jgi:hypothetical protein
VLFGLDPAEEFRLRHEAAAGRRKHPWWDLHRLTSYNPTEWHDIIPRQVGTRRPVDIAVMTGRVEDRRGALARL